MRFRFILPIILILSLFMVSCGKKREISKDDITANLPIESVAKENNKDIKDGNKLFSQGNFQSAIDHYMLATTKNRATALYNIGVSYYLLNNIHEAEVNFREAVEADPSFGEAVMNLVVVLAQQEKIFEADKYITRIIHTSKSARVYVTMANIALKMNETSKAAYYYRCARTVDPTSSYVLSNYANFLISIGAYQDGITILENFDYKDFSMNYNLANAYYLIKNNSKSYAYALDALNSEGATEEGYNKLAYLFSDLGYYADESKTLRILIGQNPIRNYKIRLVTSYIKEGEYTQALDEVRSLLKEYPSDIPLNLLNYDILVLSGNPDKAGKFIKALYKRMPEDVVLYYYTKYLSSFTASNREIRPFIFVNRDNGWLNLARTVYYLHNGNYILAKKYLSKSPSSAGHDYYMYKTFLALKDGKFLDAEQYASKMNVYRPDTFWYKLVIAWNLGKGVDIVKLAEEYEHNPVINIRFPNLKFNLKPQLVDMSFTYRFEDKGVDVASMLAYPIFIEPDEVVQFLVMGKDSLKDSEKAAATKKLQGIKLNNEGVDAFNAFDFKKAYEYFGKASLLMSNNSYVAYNTGLSLFNLGDNSKAAEYFAKSVQLDPTPPQGHLGLGLVNYRMGNFPEAEFEFGKTMSLAQDSFDVSSKVGNDGIKFYYLGVLASNKINKSIEVRAAPATDDAFVISLGRLVKYFDNNHDTTYLKDLKGSPVFRIGIVHDLLMMLHSVPSDYENITSKDRYYTLAKQFIILSKGLKNTGVYNQNFAKDKIYLKDKVYGAVYLNDKKSGLRYLQTLTRIDPKYAELYKVSLYYFTWSKEFVNAEASYRYLDRIGYRDQMTEFYKMIYFLSNYSDDRLKTRLKLYEDIYGSDYRSEIIKAAMNLKARNVPEFFKIINSAMSKDPDLFNKMFIEVNFGKF